MGINIGELAGVSRKPSNFKSHLLKHAIVARIEGIPRDGAGCHPKIIRGRPLQDNETGAGLQDGHRGLDGNVMEAGGEGDGSLIVAPGTGLIKETSLWICAILLAGIIGNRLTIIDKEAGRVHLQDKHVPGAEAISNRKNCRILNIGIKVLKGILASIATTKGEGVEAHIWKQIVNGLVKE